MPVDDRENAPYRYYIENCPIRIYRVKRGNICGVQKPGLLGVHTLIRLAIVFSNTFEAIPVWEDQ